MIDATCRSDRALLDLSTLVLAKGLRGLAAALGLVGLLSACAQQQTAPEPAPQQAEPADQGPSGPSAEQAVELALDPPPALELKAPDTPGPPHRVGLLLPLSGPRAELGQAMLQAAQMALFDVAGDQFGLIVRDTKGTPDGAAAAAESAIGRGANLLLGPVFSSSVQAVAPVARGGRVPVLAFSNNREVAGPGVYVTGLLPGAQVERVVGYAAGQGKQSFAALVPDNAYGDLVRQALQRAVEANDATLAGVRSFDPQARDISQPVRALAAYDHRRQQLEARRQELRNRGTAEARRELNRLKNRDALGSAPFDAVLLPIGGDRLRALAPTLPYYDIDPDEVQFLGTADWNDAALASDPTLRGGWFPAPPPSRWREFADRYRANYAAAPRRAAALAYDATALAALLARQAERDATPPARVYTEQALTQRSGFAGVNGIFRLNPDGLVERRYAIMTLDSNAGLKLLDPAPSSFAGPTN